MRDQDRLTSVAGHNIASASTMGQVRSMLRAYAIDSPDPGRVLRRTNAALTRRPRRVIECGVVDLADDAIEFGEDRPDSTGRPGSSPGP